MIDYDKLYSWSDDKEEPVIETDTQVQPKSELEKYILQLKNSWVPKEEAYKKVDEWKRQRWFDVFDESKQEEVEKNQGFIKETKEALSDRWNKIKEYWSDYIELETGKGKKLLNGDFKWALTDSLKSINRLYWQAGQVAWWIGDVMWEWLENTVQWIAPETAKSIENTFNEVLNTDTAQALIKSYDKWAKENPEKAISLESTINIGSLFPVWKWINMSTKWALKSGVKKVWDYVWWVKTKTIWSVREAWLKKLSWLDSKVVEDRLPFIKKYPQEALDVIDWKVSFDDAVDKIKKVSLENVDNKVLLKTAKKELQPLIDESKVKAWKLDDIASKQANIKTNNIVKKVEKWLEDLKNKKSEIGKWYDAIKDNLVGIKWNDLSTLYNKWVWEIKDKYTHLSNTSENTLKSIKSEFDKVVKQIWNWDIKYKDLKALKNNIKKTQIKEWLWTTDDAILSDFNKKLNDYLVEKIPEYKKLDTDYKIAYDNLNNLYSKVYDKNWNIKDSVYNIFKNISSPQNSKAKMEISKLLWIDEDELLKLSRELREWNSKKFDKAISAEEKIKWAWTTKEIESWIDKLNITKPNRIKKILSEIKTNEKLKEWYEKINNAVKADKIVGWDKSFTKTIFKLIDDADFNNESMATITLDKIEKVIGKNEMLKIKLYKSIFDIVGWQRIPSFANMMFQFWAFSKISGWAWWAAYMYFQKYPEKALKIILKREANIANKLKKWQTITKWEFDKVVEILSKEKLAVWQWALNNNIEQWQEQQ